MPRKEIKILNSKMNSASLKNLRRLLYIALCGLKLVVENKTSIILISIS